MQRYLDQKLKLRHLRVIDAVYTHKSLLKAASALCVTQPSLTRSLQDIEAIVGVQLFERHSKGVVENAFGKIVSEGARRVLDELGRMNDRLDELLNETTSTVSIGALPVAAVGLMPGFMSKLDETCGALQVRLVQGRTEELLPQLSSGALDLIVGRLYEPPSPDDLVREVLYHEPISILARTGHPMFMEQSAGASELKNFKLVLPTTSQRVGREIDQLLAALGLKECRPLRSSSIGFIREILQSSDFITVMPRVMMTGDLIRGAVGVLPLPVPAPPRPAGVIYRADGQVSPGAQAIVHALRGYINDCIQGNVVTAA